MSDNIIEKLRDFPLFFTMDGFHWLRSVDKDPLCTTAADRITDLEAQLAKHARIVEAATEHYRNTNLIYFTGMEEEIPFKSCDCHVCQAVRQSEVKHDPT